MTCIGTDRQGFPGINLNGNYWIATQRVVATPSKMCCGWPMIEVVSKWQFLLTKLPEQPVGRLCTRSELLANSGGCCPTTARMKFNCSQCRGDETGQVPAKSRQKQPTAVGPSQVCCNMFSSCVSCCLHPGKVCINSLMGHILGTVSCYCLLLSRRRVILSSTLPFFRSTNSLDSYCSPSHVRSHIH